MNESIQKCKFLLQLLKRIRLLNLYAHFTCVKFNVSYLNYIQTWWGGQISHNSSIKCFFVQVSSCITTWKGCTLKFLTFIFLHWLIQCPSEDLCFLQHSEPLFMYII